MLRRSFGSILAQPQESSRQVTKKDKLQISVQEGAGFMEHKTNSGAKQALKQSANSDSK